MAPCASIVLQVVLLQLPQAFERSHLSITSKMAHAMVIFSMAFRNAYHCTLKRAAPQKRATSCSLLHTAVLSDMCIFSGFVHF
jgi:uncharacterized membrane protein